MHLVAYRIAWRLIVYLRLRNAAGVSLAIVFSTHVPPLSDPNACVCFSPPSACFDIGKLVWPSLYVCNLSQCQRHGVDVHAKQVGHTMLPSIMRSSATMAQNRFNVDCSLKDCAAQNDACLRFEQCIKHATRAVDVMSYHVS